jgi:hypothetical protein
VVNNRIAAGQSDQRAFRQEWAVVHRSWKKPKNGGKWVAKGYPEYNENQPRGADGQWSTGGGSGGSGGGGSKPSESGWRRAGRYVLGAAALAGAGALALPYLRSRAAADLGARAARAVGLGGKPQRASGASRRRAARAAGGTIPKSPPLAKPSKKPPTKAAIAALTRKLRTVESLHASAVLRRNSLLAQLRFHRNQLKNTKPGEFERLRFINRNIEHFGQQYVTAAEHAIRLARQATRLRGRLLAAGITDVARRGLKRATKRRVPTPVYVCRYLINTDDIVAWAKSQGFPTTIDPKDLHVTIAYSRQPIDWPTPQNNRLVMRPSDNRLVERLGDKGAVVLRFNSPLLTGRWKEIRAAGASWDHGDQYKPHITISYRVAPDFDLGSVEPYSGPLIFGPERVKPLEENIEHVEKLREILNIVPGSAASFSKALRLYHQPNQAIQCQLLKAENKKLGLIFGWAIISSENGQPYYDTQGDHIPDDSMLRAATEFMESKRTMKIMHGGKKVGTVVFAWPMTPEIAQAMGVKGNRTGLMIAVKPDNPNVLERFRNSQYTGFSIGGNRLIDEDADNLGTQKAASFGMLKDKVQHATN